MSPAAFRLRPVTLDDVDALFGVYSDPDTWKHLPDARFTERSQMSGLVLRWLEEWDRVGLSTWVVEVDDLVVGSCGVMPRDGWWNLGFRLSPTAWGGGVATAAARRSVEAGQVHRPDWPVVARSLVTNPASGRVSEKAGLRLVWSGHSVEGPDRVIHADRPLEPELFEAVKALG
ncbi:MAG: N-acetyltransferase [Actinomycetales bacterium]|nr:MAG: N-acetyltransferase [Actinomycetales bacterium]